MRRPTSRAALDLWTVGSVGPVTRRRLAVALLAPRPQAAEVNVLRRAVGLAEPFPVAPHLTLVPPVNVAEADLPAVREVLRRVATATNPLELEVGPVATFLPETPTLHLAVGGSDLSALRSLRGHLRCGPFDRPDVWPFHPHVTIVEHAGPELIEAGLVAFASMRQHWSVGALHLLEQRRHGPGHPLHGGAYWVPVREEPFGGPCIVGRGGAELVLRTAGVVEPDVACIAGVDMAASPTPGAPTPLVVVAEDGEDAGAVGAVLGAAIGSIGSGRVAELQHVTVSTGRRRMGVGRHLVAEWCSQAAHRGAVAAVAPEHADGFLGSLGFRPASGLLLRHL